MPPALVYAIEPDVDLLAAYAANCSRLGLTGVNLPKAAASFLRRWPDPQQWAAEPVAVRLAASADKRAFVMFLMLSGHLRPGYDYPSTASCRRSGVIFRSGRWPRTSTGSSRPPANSASPNAPAAASARR
jgi:hypothetical protein